MIADRTPGARTIGIIGPHDAGADLCELAAEAGRSISSVLGAVIVCGGLTGIMQAAAAGARAAGGICVGLLPGRDPSAGNEFLTVAIATGAGQQRNQMIVDSSQALVSVGDNEGTRDEIVRAARAGKVVVTIVGADDPVPDDTVARRYVRSADQAVAAVATSLGWPLPECGASLMGS